MEMQRGEGWNQERLKKSPKKQDANRPVKAMAT